jgi:hypothetical protein
MERHRVDSRAGVSTLGDDSGRGQSLVPFLNFNASTAMRDTGRQSSYRGRKSAALE